MKRVVFLLTTVFGAALLAGCGKLEDQEPVAKDTGAQTNAAAHGSGALTLSDGRTAVETNVEAQRSFVMRDGTVYEGGMKDGKPDGRGTVANPNGTFQKGEWRDGRPYRISGIWVAPDGTKEEGTWNYDGSASGGTILWKDDLARRQGRGRYVEAGCVSGIGEVTNAAGARAVLDAGT